jgi:hypothetical protein
MKQSPQYASLRTYLQSFLAPQESIIGSMTATVWTAFRSRLLVDEDAWHKQIMAWMKMGSRLTDEYWIGVLKSTFVTLARAGHGDSWIIGKNGANYGVMAKTSAPAGPFDTAKEQGLLTASTSLTKMIWPYTGYSDYLGLEEPV